MPRSFASAFRSDFESPRASNVILIFAVFYSPYFEADINVVNDVVNYTLLGRVFIGFPFQIELLEDSDKAPRGKITVQNVDASMGQALRTLQYPPKIDIALYSSSDWNTVIDPSSNSRLPIGTPTQEYIAQNLQLWDLTITASTVEGTFGPPDISQEFWPQSRCTKDNTPGLFR
jgi:hypothetical protein